MSNKMDYVDEDQPRPRRRSARSADVSPAEIEEEPLADANEHADADDYDSDDEDRDDQVLEGTAPAPARHRPRLPALVAAAVAVLVVAALVLSVVEWAAADSRYSSQQALRTSALQAASKYGVYLSSYNYKNLNGTGAPWAEVDAHSTPSFRKDFNSTKSNLSSLVTDYKATATGKVVAAGLSSVSSKQAVALLFIDQTVTNTAQKPGTSTQPLRVELVMIRQNGKWLINKLQVPS